MNRNSIRWRLPISYAVVALVAALALGSLMLLVLRGYYNDQERQYLEGNAITLQPLIAEILQSNLPTDLLRDQVNGLSFLSQTQIRLLDENGHVIADSGVPNVKQVVAVSAGVPVPGDVMFSVPVDAPDEKGPLFIFQSEDRAGIPQVIPFEKQVVPGKAADIIISVNASPYGYGFAAKAEFDPERRSSENVSVVLFDSGGNKLGSLEFSNGPSYGADVINSVTLAWLIASVFAIAIAALAGWAMSRRVTSPVLVLENATRQMEQGDLSVRVVLQNEKQQEFLALARSFNGMAEQVEQTVSTLREFVADAAHELHTPVTALQANIELARDETNASERTLYLTRAQEQGQRLEAMVESLLRLSRIEGADAQVKSSFEPVDMIRLVREVGEQFASRAEQAERTFSMTLSDDELKVLGNEMQLKQVFMNLLENALKFTPASGAILLDLQRAENELVLTVSDSGIGIPPEDLPQLFERFHRGRNVAAYPGNGLGLAIVKAIVDSYSGQVEAHSAGHEEGSRFVVRIPMA